MFLIDTIKIIIDKSKTILWNGPAGYFENPEFANGSIEIAKKIIENNNVGKIFSVVGGGDTVSILNTIGFSDTEIDILRNKAVIK